MLHSYYIQDAEKGVEKSWWNRRSQLEKALVIFVAVALLIIIILAILLIVFFTCPSRTCISTSCIQSANEISEYIDEDVDPCDDFYEFACGKYLENLDLGDRPHMGTEMVFREHFHDRIRGLIEEPQNPNDTRSMIMAKKLYSACMSPEAVEKGVQSLKATLRQMGGWAALEGDDWKEEYFDWRSATYKLRQSGYNVNFLIILRVVPDENEPSKQILQLSSPWNMLDSVTAEDEKIHYNYMVDLAVAFGANRARAEADYKDVIDFIKSLETTERQEKERFTISELQYKFRDIPWLEYTQQTLFPVPNIYYDQIIEVTDIPYIFQFQNVLQNTTKRILSNYIVFKIILEQSTILTPDIAELFFNYIKAINKLSPNTFLMPPRPIFCSSTAGNMFPLAVQYAYTEKYISEDAESDTETMIQNIINQFKDEINDLKWIDEETKSKALERLAEINSHVSSSIDAFDPEVVDNTYIGYYMQQDNFLSSILNVNYHLTNAKFRQLHESDEEKKPVTELKTDVFYRIDDNSINVPSAVFQSIIFDENRPEYLNYGGLGSYIGREIAHAIFERAPYYHESSYYDWMSNETSLEYNNKLSCVEEHYSQYFVPEVQKFVNSSNTKYEDISDIVGVRLAYDAYNEWADNNGPEQKLPQLGYTPKQLFWISSAIRYCSKSSVMSMEREVSYFLRSPHRYRVLGTLRNLEDFSKDFSCAEDSYMNPNDKCNIL